MNKRIQRLDNIAKELKTMAYQAKSPRMDRDVRIDAGIVSNLATEIHEIASHFSEVVSVSEPTDEQILFAIRQDTKLGLGEGIYEAEEEIVRCINERDKNILRVVKKVFEVLKEDQK